MIPRSHASHALLKNRRLTVSVQDHTPVACLDMQKPAVPQAVHPKRGHKVSPGPSWLLLSGMDGCRELPSHCGCGKTQGRPWWIWPSWDLHLPDPWRSDIPLLRFQYTDFDKLGWVLPQNQQQRLQFPRCPKRATRGLLVQELCIIYASMPVPLCLHIAHAF